MQAFLRTFPLFNFREEEVPQLEGLSQVLRRVCELPLLFCFCRISLRFSSPFTATWRPRLLCCRICTKYTPQHAGLDHSAPV